MFKMKKKKNTKTSWIYLGVAIAAILFLIVALYLQTRVRVYDFDSLYQRTLDGKESEINYIYNGFVFVRPDVFWETVILKQGDPPVEFQLATYHSPRSLEHIPTTFNRTAVTQKSQIFLTFNPALDAQTTIAGIEVGKVIGQRYGILNIPTQQGVYTEYEGSFPIITCDNVSRNTGVIKFLVTNTTEIVEENGCILLKAQTSTELIAVANRFIFSLLGIMS